MRFRPDCGSTVVVSLPSLVGDYSDSICRRLFRWSSKGPRDEPAYRNTAYRMFELAAAVVGLGVAA